MMMTNDTMMEASRSSISNSKIQSFISSVVLVKVEGPDPKESKIKHFSFYETNNNGKSSFSASGVIFHQDDQFYYIVTSASIIIPFQSLMKLNNNNSNNNKHMSVNMSIMINGIYSREFKAQYMGIVKNENADKYIYQLIGQQVNDFYWGWTTTTTTFDGNGEIYNNNNASSSSSSGHDEYLIGNNSPSQFAVLRILKSNLVGKDNDRFQNRISCAPLSSNDTWHSSFSSAFTSPAIEQMKSIYVISSPFGLLSPQTFSNTVTRGIVSNVILNSKYECLAFLTDARMMPGSEGGGVFDKSVGSCIGLCTMPIRSRSSNMELNLVISFNAVRRQLFDLISTSNARDNHNNNNASDVSSPMQLQPSKCSFSPTSLYSNSIASHLIPKPFENAKKSIVLINVADSWSSGILINNRGLVLTNAHLFAPYAVRNRVNASIVVQLDADMYNLERNHKFFNASLLFMNTTGPFDVALIQIDNQALPRIDYFISIDTDVKMKQGQVVYGIGYPLFNPISVNSALRTSTITEGTLAKIVKKKGIPTLLQTSALIHRGNSGGGIFNVKGEFIGLVTSNAKHNSNQSLKTPRLMPSMNFALPAARLKQIRDYAENPSQYTIQRLITELNSPAHDLASVWKLSKTVPKQKKKGQDEKRSSNFLSYLEKMGQDLETPHTTTNSDFLNSKL